MAHAWWHDVFVNVLTSVFGELLLPAGKVQRLASHYFVMCALTIDASMGSIVAVLFCP